MFSVMQFVSDSIKVMFQGGARYWIYVGTLGALVLFGGWHYFIQLRDGLIVTGMSDQVSWGFYIANFAFLVGIAASAVLLVIPAYIFHRDDAKHVVLVGEAMAVAAVITSMLFVIVDLGRPERLWHMIPVLGSFNFPMSLLAWDVVVLGGYLLLTLAIPFHILYSHYRGGEAKLASYFPFIVVAIFWAIAVHTVTAFLFSANSARPFWHTSLLGPRFLASAFASGPALIILTLELLRKLTKYPIRDTVIGMLALIMTVALQINLFFVGVELFTDYYNAGAHAASIHYLFQGRDGFDALTPWIWSALAMNVVAVVILTIHPLRRNTLFLNVACVLVLIGIWIEKGMALVVPGFIPTPLGEIFEYSPTSTELGVSLGVWALGILIFTVLTKACIAIESGYVRQRPRQGKSVSEDT